MKQEDDSLDYHAILSGQVVWFYEDSRDVVPEDLVTITSVYLPSGWARSGCLEPNVILVVLAIALITFFLS